MNISVISRKSLRSSTQQQQHQQQQQQQQPQQQQILNSTNSAGSSSSSTASNYNSEVTRCGDISYSIKSKFFTFHCTFCNENFTNFDFLSRHIRSHPLPIKFLTSNKMRNYNLGIDEKIVGDIVLAAKMNQMDFLMNCTMCKRKIFEIFDFLEHIESGHFKGIDNDLDLNLSINGQSINNLDLIKQNKDTSVEHNTTDNNSDLTITAAPQKEIKLKCEVCHKNFRNFYNLAIHKRTHSADKPFRCHLCNGTFTQKSTLTVHLRIHSGIKPFKCDICGKSFPRNYALTLHKKTHSGLKPFCCTADGCFQKFSTRSNLVSHRNRMHGEDSTNMEKLE